jgi:hypothetical protein
MAYVEALMLDEFERRWTAEELAYDPRSGWGGGRVIKPRPQPLHGFWLRIAAAVFHGCETEDEVAVDLRCSTAEVNRAVHRMVRAALLRRDGVKLSVTKRAKRQIVEAEI